MSGHIAHSASYPMVISSFVMMILPYIGEQNAIILLFCLLFAFCPAVGIYFACLCTALGHDQVEYESSDDIL